MAPRSRKAGRRRAAAPPGEPPEPGLRLAPAVVVHAGRPAPVQRWLAVEAPLTLRVDGEPLATLWRTPGQEEALATGFLLTEGLIRSAGEVRTLRVGSGAGGRPAGTVDIDLESPDRVETWRKHYRRVFSSCGLCGPTAVEDVRNALNPVPPPDQPIAPHRIADLARELRRYQVLFEASGGVHGVGLFDPDGRLLAMGEDIGRHNALDKAIGQAARAGLALGGRWLMTSGRSSFEIIAKAARVGVSLVAGVSAPTDLAVALAQSLGLVLVGFVRGRSLTIYAGADRVAGT